MGNEYNADGKIILRDTSGNQMSLPRFFQLALIDGNGNYARPTSHHHLDAWDMGTGGALTVPARTPVFGTVIAANQTGWNGEMGTSVIIDEGNGRTHYFMHMVENSLVVSVGDEVKQGDKLGLIGNTGNSFGAHLHYDVREGGSRIGDPMLAYDCTTLPSGWNFPDAVDNGNNWDYIPLDQTATDYGPPGGETPSEPFFTDKCLYDISTYQSGAKSTELATDTTTGGFIIKWGQANSLSNYFQDDKFTTHLQNANDHDIPVGFYFYWEMNPDGLSDSDITNLFTTVFQYLTDAGVTPENTELGIWLDYEGSHSATPANNDHVVELFNQVGTELGFPVVGFYTYKSFLDANFTVASVKDYPFWYSRPGVSRSTVDSELSGYGFTAAYLWQDGYPDGGGWSPSKTYYHQDVDNDTVLQPIPTTGGGGGGGGGGSYTEVIKVTVDVIPPKRIYFSPVPGIIPTMDTRLDEREQEITITTDADNASLYYTLDGSSPYQYTTNNGTTAYTVAANALLYSSSITINKDTHIRVIAVPSGTSPGMTFDEPLAKGSGTFLFQYQNVAQTWEEEQKSYATSDGAVSFFEENKQAFLRLHAEQTDEEILYTEVYRHDTQVAESDASDSASKTEEGGQPTYDGSDEPTDTTEEEGDADVSDE